MKFLNQGVFFFVVFACCFVSVSKAQTDEINIQETSTIANSELADEKTPNFISREITNLVSSEDSLKPQPTVEIGGAIRLNYSWKDYDEQNKNKNGEFGFELFRLNADIDYSDIFLSVEYRLYGNFNAIHHGYFGYHINDKTSFQIGVNQVPFGIAPYSSHSFWFNATYYLGFEDDYDTGVKLIYDSDNWNLQAAFYKNAEYNDATKYGRYSFDLVTDDVQTNEEINQFNLRSIYKWKPSNELTMNIGLSVEYGQIYNQTTAKNGNRHAYAIHNNALYKNWNLHLQYIDYAFNPENPEGISDKTIQFGAFMYPFMVSSKASVYSLNLARDINIDGKYIDKIKLYGNFSAVNPKQGYGSNSKQIVLGTTIIKRGLYAYFDYIMGQNMWFSGGPGIGLKHPEDTLWKSRLNINFGYYF